MPKSVYKFSEDGKTLLGFKDEFLNDPDSEIYKDNFQDCDTMQIPANVTSVNENAFCISTETFTYETTIPPFIKNLTFAEGSNCSLIGNRVFYKSSLTSVKLPSALITIQDSVFEGCSSLTSVDFSNATNLSSIGYCSFGYGPTMVTVDLSKCSNLTEISQSAFRNNNALTSVTLPTNLKIIGAQAFTYCDQLTSVNFSECTGLTQIKDAAFGHCPLLSTSVDLENAINLTSIGQQAFRFCDSLTSISLPSSLTSLSFNTFSDCPNLNSITWDAWDGNTSLVNSSFLRVSSKGTVVVTGSSRYDGVDLLQYLVNNGGLPESWLPAPELPDDVYIIENNVLKGFTSGFLANPSAYRLCDTMEIPANVTSIADGAFSNDLESTIPSFITKLTFAKGSVCSTIGSYVFCSSPLTSVTLPDSLTTIGEAAFTFSKLTSVTFPAGLAYVNRLAFAFCESLASVKFSRSLKTIGICCFQNCPLLTNVELLNSRELTSIGQQAFRGCSSLSLVSFPSSLESIGLLAFMDCSSLTSVILTNAINLKSIDEYAFQSCTSLRSIDFTKPADLSYIGRGAFNGCSKLSSVVLPTNLETISKSCFAGCSSLTSVTFPSHLSQIEMYAFNGCSSLTSVSFPKDLLTVESSAFNNCSNLNSITWDAWNGNTNLQPTSFSGVCQTGGTVIVNNPSGEYDSRALLNYLLRNGGLPESWVKDVVNPLPEEVYEFSNGGKTLLGFTEEFLANQNNYKYYNTILISDNINYIEQEAFAGKIPSFIKNIIFSTETKDTNIDTGYGIFYNNLSITSVVLPGNLDIRMGIFLDCSNLSSITWDAWSWDSFESNNFSGVAATGTVKVTHPIDSEHDSATLLDLLKRNGGLPSGWTVAED